MARKSSKRDGFVTLKSALESRNSEELKGLAKVFSKKVPLTKRDRVQLILHVVVGAGLREVWEGLDALSQSAIAEVVHGCDDLFDEGLFYAKYGALPKRYYYASHRSKDNPSHSKLDLFFTNDRLPHDLQERLESFVAPPAEAKIKTLETLPETVREEIPEWRLTRGEEGAKKPLAIVETEEAGIHDLQAVLRLVEAGKISVSKTTKKVTGAGAKAVMAVLDDDDFLEDTFPEKPSKSMRPFAWPLIVQGAGLASLSGSKLQLSRTGKAALSKPAHEVIKSAWTRWLKNSLLDEFNRIDEIKGQNRKGRGGLSAAAPRRLLVNQVLSLCPPGAWINIDELFRFFRASDNDFEISYDPWKLYLCEPRYGSLGHGGFHMWSMLQGRFIMCLLWEYAATLGLLDIAHVPANGARSDFCDNWGADDLEALSRYDGLKFFRINALGAYCLGLTNTYTPAPQAVRPVLRVLANHDIIVTDATQLRAADVLFLDRMCKRSGENCWKLDRAQILEASETGSTPQELLEFLSARNDGPLQDNITQYLKDIAKRVSEISSEGNAEVFLVTEETTALLIAHDTTAGKLCYLAGSNRLIVPTKHSNAFRRALRTLGYVALAKRGS